MPDEPRRSRIGWPEVTGDPPEYALIGHTHEQKRGALGWLFVAVAGLVLVVALVVTYILARGAQRDEENEQVQEQIRESWCLALDSLPAGGVLDILRERYECGPGVDLDDLPPEIRQQYERRPTPVPADPTMPLAPVPPLGSAASPDAPRIAPNMPGPGNTAPQPSPEPGPVVDPEPVTDLVCDLAGLCL